MAVIAGQANLGAGALVVIRPVHALRVRDGCGVVALFLFAAAGLILPAAGVAGFFPAAGVFRAVPTAGVAAVTTAITGTAAAAASQCTGQHSRARHFQEGSSVHFQTHTFSSVFDKAFARRTGVCAADPTSYYPLPPGFVKFSTRF